MEVYFELVKNGEHLKRVCEEKFSSEDCLGLDTETTGFDPHEGSLRLIQLSNSKATIVVDLIYFAENGSLKENEMLEPLRRILKDKEKTKFIHNAKFDTKWIQHHLGVELGGIFDTMLASQLLHSGDQEKRHSLAEVAQFFLGLELDKSEQKSDWSSSELTESQLKYAATDAVVAFRLGKQIEEKLMREALTKTAQIEFNCITPLSNVEMNGIYVDLTSWQKNLNETLQKKLDLSENLKKNISNLNSQNFLFSKNAEIDINDQNQVRSALGISASSKSLQKELRTLAATNPTASMFLEYLETEKFLSEFGEDFLKLIKPQTQRLHPDYKQIATFSGNIRCYKPNLYQLPLEYRKCLVAPENKKLILAFYPDLEFRAFAELSQDKDLINTLTNNVDFQIALSTKLFNLDSEQLTEEHMLLTKRLSYAVIYGAGASYLAKLNGISTEEAEELFRRFFALYPRLWQWLESLSQKAEQEKICRSTSGRICKLKFDTEEKRKSAKRYARSFHAQALSTDIFKHCLYLLDKNLKNSSARIIHLFQHGYLIECYADETKKISDLTKEVMKKAGEEFINSVPIRVESRESESWSF
ncbi:MAG: DNA polymerase [Pyrinomonadaceae bacterium]|nr:DNA polymerase [Pyrinomonadaceae bacterium]MCX7639900.1 DNA polymerase [Pyrinomonadaceae bacterium]MDW8304072.1 DNA polymerase [Acidobacteriota bacterium]